MAKKRSTKRKQQRNLQQEEGAVFEQFIQKHHSLVIGLALTLLTWGVFFLWYWPRMLYMKNGDLVTQGKYVWADWSAHLAYAAHFAWRPIGDWFESHPLFFGADFSYPFAMDALSGVLMKWGVGEAAAFVIPSILITAWLLVVLVLFYHAFLRSGLWSFIAVSLFLAGGSTLFLWYYFPELVASSSLLPENHEHLIGWKNIVVSEIIPQRAFLLGMPWMLSLLLGLSRLDNNTRSWQIALYGVASAFLLCIHVHSFIALSIVGAVLLAYRWKMWRPIALYALATGILSLPIFWWMYLGGVGDGFVHLQFGWMKNSGPLDHNVVFFWLMNWSVFLPLALWATVRTRLWQDPFVMSGFVIFIVCNIVVFQPWDWDNQKILTWAYLFLTIPIIKYFQDLWEQKNRAIVAIAMTITLPLLMLGGFIEIGIHTGHAEEQRIDKNAPLPKDMANFIVRESTIFSQEEFVIARTFRDLSDPTAVVLTADRVTNWVAGLTGRNILLGYRGWMWTYGLEDGERYQDIRTMFAGGAEAERLLQQYGIDYVVIGFPEIQNYGANETYFLRRYPLVIDSPQNRVYKIIDPR